MRDAKKVMRVLTYLRERITRPFGHKCDNVRGGAVFGGVTIGCDIGEQGDLCNSFFEI